MTELPSLTAQEAQLLLDYADFQRAAGELSDKDWLTYRHAREKLIGVIVNEAFEQANP